MERTAAVNKVDRILAYLDKREGMAWDYFGQFSPERLDVWEARQLVAGAQTALVNGADTALLFDVSVDVL